jgi:hypothetical protein
MYEELGDGLILRTGTESDFRAIKQHVQAVHGKEVPPMIDRLFNYHPNFPPSDNFLIEDSKTGKIVAYYCLKQNTGIMEGYKIPVGQMEIVGTLEEYRNRGLIRKLNEAFEQRVEEYKLPMVIIAGIPYYYRKLGYEYAIRMGGQLTVPLEVIPALKKGETEPVSIEEVTPDTLSEYLKARQKHNSYLDFYRHLSDTEFQYLTTGRFGDDSVYKFHLMRHNQKVVGIFILHIGWGNLEVVELWVEDLNHLMPVLRFTKRLAKRKRLPLSIYYTSRPAITQALESLSRSKFRRPYAWYVKIPSIKRFVETIKPVIEQRIAQSDFKGLTESLRLSWYQEGLELVFKKGKLTAIKSIPREEIKDMHIAVPFPVIYQLLLGYRSIEELHQIFPDAGGRAIKTPIIRVIFPKIAALWMPEF